MTFFSADYIISKEKGTSPLGPIIPLTNGKLCISMLIGMCETCSLRLTISTGKEDLSEVTYTAKVSLAFSH